MAKPVALSMNGQMRQPLLGRAMLLRRAGTGGVDDVDWDSMRFRLRRKNRAPRYRTLDLSNPLAFTREELEPLLARTESLAGLLDELGAPASDPPSPTPWSRSRTA